MIPMLVALASGVLLTAAMPPTGLWPAALSLVALFAMVSHAERPREAFGLGAAFAFGFFLLYILWLPMSFSSPAMLGPFFWVLYPFLLLALSAMWGLVTWGAYVVGGRGGPVLVVLPVFWVLMEWARAQGYFAFPWGTLGYLWIDTPVAQAAEGVGVTGLSLLTAAAAAALAAPFAAPSPRRLRSSGPPVVRIALPAVALVALAATWWWGTGRLAEPVGPTERTALLVQGNVDPFARAVSASEELDVHTTITQIGVSGMAQAPDLVIWPEGAVIGFDLEGELGDGVRARIQESAPTSTFVVGGRAREDGRSFNSAFAIDGAGLTDRYDKHVLVPFGERWPLLESARPLYGAVFAALNLPMLVNTSPGPGPVPLRTGIGPVALAVCYESVFPELSATSVLAGARVLVTVTNDAWFAWGNGARQHLDMGRMRAIETRRFLLRAANDGVTAAVDPYGRITAEIPRGISSQLPVRFGMREELTPYVRYGGFTPAALAVLGLAATVAALVRRRL